MFEVGNHTFRKYDRANSEDAPDGFIVRSNFAFTGDGSGSGQARYERASELIKKAAASRTLSHAFLLRVVARDLKNDVIDPYPLPYEGKQDGRPAGYIRTFNAINRFRTISCAVFHGVLQDGNPRLTTMWTILGEPVWGIALPVWPLAGSTPLELGGPATAPLNDITGVKKALFYPLTSSPEYINTAALDDGHGGGAFSYTFPIEDWTLARAGVLLAEWRASLPTPQVVAAAQNEIALQAYWCFLASSVPTDILSEPLNMSCRTFKKRSFFLRQYVHRLDWQAPATGSAVSYRIYDVSTGNRVLVAEVPAGTRSYLRRHVDPAHKYIYAVLGVEQDRDRREPGLRRI